MRLPTVNVAQRGNTPVSAVGGGGFSGFGTPHSLIVTSGVSESFPATLRGNTATLQPESVSFFFFLTRDHLDRTGQQEMSNQSNQSPEANAAAATVLKRRSSPSATGSN